MFRVSISPQWTIESPDGGSLGPRVVDLLVRVAEHGSLAAACSSNGLSYRHAWQLLREGEALFGQPLLVMARGKGSLLTPLGERLVWAERRVQARLAPLLHTLASEVSTELERLLSAAGERLRIHVSHGFAVQALQEALVRDGVAHGLKYVGSAESLESLAIGQCDVAGLHVPVGALESDAVAHYRAWLEPARQRLIRLATRRQGLMTQAGNPKRIYDVADLARPGVRFINRQAGSGTRFLLDRLLHGRGITPAQVQGYEQCEFTHAAVAAFVASGMADAAMGVEVPARSFKLDFIPLLQERYFLVCHEDRLATPPFQRLLELLRSEAFVHAVDGLPGYAADRTGEVVALGDELPELAAAAPAPAPARARKGARPAKV